jgi:hypothetical protein
MIPHFRGWGGSSHFLDIGMEHSIRQELESLKADPDFVLLVMAWHGEIGASEVPFTAEKESAAYQKKIKRWTQRDCGTGWKFYWQVILNDCLKLRRRITLRRHLFKMEPLASNPAKGPRNRDRWNAIFDLRNYLLEVTGKPQMALLGRLFYPNQNEMTFNKEWDKRKRLFEKEEGDVRLRNLRAFYTQNRDRILETLRTGIPFYAQWETRG